MGSYCPDWPLERIGTTEASEAVWPGAGVLKSGVPGQVLAPPLKEPYAIFEKLLILSKSPSEIIVIPTS